MQAEPRHAQPTAALSPQSHPPLTPNFNFYIWFRLLPQSSLVCTSAASLVEGRIQDAAGHRPLHPTALSCNCYPIGWIVQNQDNYCFSAFLCSVKFLRKLILDQTIIVHG